MNQSFAGMFATVPAAALICLTWLLAGASYYGAGEAAGGICCMFIPCTLATLIGGVLGLTEETPRGERRDGTLAKWSLWAAAGCWGMVGLLLLLCRLLRG